MYVVLRVPGYW